MVELQDDMSAMFSLGSSWKTYQPNALLDESYPKLFACCKNILIRLATCGTSDVFDARSASPQDIIDEWEKGI